MQQVVIDCKQIYDQEVEDSEDEKEYVTVTVLGRGVKIQWNGTVDWKGRKDYWKGMLR